MKTKTETVQVVIDLEGDKTELADFLNRVWMLIPTGVSIEMTADNDNVTAEANRLWTNHSHRALWA